MGKILLLSFSDEEETTIKFILSVLGTGRIPFKIEEKFVNNMIEYNGLSICLDRREIYHNKQKINMTFTEFEILYLLARNPGKVFSKEAIYNTVWKELYDGDHNVVMSHIRNIREKIEDNPKNPVYIQTVWKSGYRFNQNIGSNQ